MRACLRGIVIMACLAGSQLHAEPQEPEAETNAVARRIVPGASERPDAFAHALIFQDGGQLRGRLVSLIDDEILWRRPDASEMLRIRRGDVRRIVLRPPPGYGGEAADTAEIQGPQPLHATVKLSGADWLYGDAVSDDGQTFAFHFRGTPQEIISIARDRIEWMYFDTKAAPTVSYRGNLSDAEDWTINPSTKPAVTNGVLSIEGWFRCRVPSLEQVEVAFAMPAGGDEGLSVSLLNVTWHVQGHHMHLLGPGPKKQVTELSGESPSGKVSYRILYDIHNRTVLVMRNDLLAAEWVVPEPAPPKAEKEFSPSELPSIQFQALNGGVIRFNRLEIKPWDGAPPSEEAAGEKMDRSSIAGQAQVIGRLNAISTDAIRFGGASIPLAEQTLLQFPSSVWRFAEPDCVLRLGRSILPAASEGNLNATNLRITHGRVECETPSIPHLELPCEEIAAITFPAAAAVDRSDRLVFENGDELPGHLVEGANGELLRWRTPVGQEVDIRADHVMGMQMSAKPEAQGVVMKEAVVDLRNGDHLRGQSAAMDAETVQFWANCLGEVVFPKGLLRALWPNSQNASWDAAAAGQSFAAASSPKVYAKSTAWPYTKGKSAAILDDFHIIRRTADAESKGEMCANGFDFFCEHPPDRFEFSCEITALNAGNKFYTFNISKSYGSIFDSIDCFCDWKEVQIRDPRRLGGRNPDRILPMKDVFPGFGAQLSLHAFVDSRLGFGEVFLDGVSILEYGRAPWDRRPGYGFIHIFSDGNLGGNVTISNVAVRPWYGGKPSITEGDPGISFSNDDVVSGTAKQLKDGKLLIESELGLIESPIDKIRSIDAGVGFAPQINAARLRLRDGSLIHVDRWSWRNRKVTAHSPVFGKFEVPAEDLRALILEAGALWNPMAVRP